MLVGVVGCYGSINNVIICTSYFILGQYIADCSPCNQVSFTFSYELWIDVVPSLEHLRPWNLAAYVHITSGSYGKLGPKAKKCIFMCYFK